MMTRLSPLTERAPPMYDRANADADDESASVDGAHRLVSFESTTERLQASVRARGKKQEAAACTAASQNFFDARARWGESPSRSRFLIEHDLFGKPLHTFPDHALTHDPERTTSKLSMLVRCSHADSRNVSREIRPANCVRPLQMRECVPMRARGSA